MSIRLRYLLPSIPSFIVVLMWLWVLCGVVYAAHVIRDVGVRGLGWTLWCGQRGCLEQGKEQQQP